MLKITIDTDDSDFKDGAEKAQLLYILNNYIREIEQHVHTPYVDLCSINGKKIGKVEQCTSSLVTPDVKPRPCAKCAHGEDGAAVPYGPMCYFCCTKCWSYFEEKKEK